ncbi:MAG: hypothetical protein A7315_06895 [Candidatus Altiarchaeales archaeon WOR_SM1_79]|nr:MAG: hypothetical protein A7315_06895 [Candidatus Altiarchaeales archaeon WOR_SM1_79]
MKSKTPHQAGKKEPKTNILLISTLFFVVFCSNVAAIMPPYPVFIYTNSTYGELVAQILTPPNTIIKRARRGL